ncbi:MAG: hypothetical protein SWE60_13410, partial [Thermodesulfobacteriota bacterium]|nr:hypothetical protein [Thermodesulfobacteriota bacterium]
QLFPEYYLSSVRKQNQRDSRHGKRGHLRNHLHGFHIPVMGIGHSVDTPIRVAPLGIGSVISLVDDILLERIRKYYCKQYGFPYVRLGRNEPDGRAKRVTAYLDMVEEIVLLRMERIRRQPFFEANDKRRYFELLPEESDLKQAYNRFLKMDPGHGRDACGEALTEKMRPGSIDVNIMVKLDAVNYDSEGFPLDDEFSDAKAALRGYANSGLRSAIVFSAGINKTLFKYMTRFGDFYRDQRGEIKKRIILKVSDFRSALIQGKFLAKQGLEVDEFRIESGLNCGGHAFPTNGRLLPCLLQEFKEKRERLTTELMPLVQSYYEKMGWAWPVWASISPALVTVQGGIGTHGEASRLTEGFGMDLTGWASPFLLVPEATCVDTPTRGLLAEAQNKDLFVSDVSPLEIPFNNVRGTGSEIWTSQRVSAGSPGSSCPKRFLRSNTEFSEKPLCLASRKYQQRKLAEIDDTALPDGEKRRLRQKVVAKTCICDHLGNGALIALGMAKETTAPPLVCPGPNIAWYNRTYSLKEMVDHIYGRGPSLVPAERPHMFAAEIVMYVDYFEQQVASCSCSPRELKTLEEFNQNLERGMDFCLAEALKPPYPGENLASIAPCVERQRIRLRGIVKRLEARMLAVAESAAACSSKAAPGEGEKKDRQQDQAYLLAMKAEYA